MNVIYLRTSTEEQNPENQLSDCLNLANNLEIKDTKTFEDKVSGWKDIKREGFDKIYEEIKKRHVQNIICWDLDRLYRNRKRLIGFFEFCKLYGCKIHSVRQNWLESLNSMPEPFNEIMHSLMLQIMGWLAEEESNKKSDRVKNAIRRKNGKTKSYKGNLWGRRSINKRVVNEIVSLRESGLTIRKITEKVYYYDKNNHKKFVSIGLVHKILDKIQQEKSLKSDVQ